MTTAPRARHKGRRVAVGLVFALVAIAASLLTAWFLTREPSGPIVALVPTGDGRVILLRRGYEERGYVHLMLSSENLMQWSEALFGVEGLDTAGDEPTVQVVGDRVYVRAREARGHSELHVFTLDEGRFLWRGGRPTEEAPDGLPRFGEQTLFVGDEVVWLVHGGAEYDDRAPGPQVIALDLEGEELARVSLEVGEPGQATADAAMFGDALYVLTEDGVVHRVSSSGEVTQVGVGMAGLCATGGALVIGHRRWVPGQPSGEAGLEIGPMRGCDPDGGRVVAITLGDEVAVQRVEDGAFVGGVPLAGLSPEGLESAGRFDRYVRLGDSVWDTTDGSVVEGEGEVVPGGWMVSGDTVRRIGGGEKRLPGLQAVRDDGERVWAHDGQDVVVWRRDAF